MSFVLGYQDSHHPMPEDLAALAATLGMTVDGEWSQSNSVVWYGVMRSFSGESQADATSDQQAAVASWLISRADVNDLLIGNLLEDNSTDNLDPSDIIQ